MGAYEALMAQNKTFQQTAIDAVAFAGIEALASIVSNKVGAGSESNYMGLSGIAVAAGVGYGVAGLSAIQGRPLGWAVRSGVHHVAANIAYAVPDFAADLKTSVGINWYADTLPFSK